MSIEDKIYAKKAATDMYDLAMDEASRHFGDAALHFWLTLYNFIRHLIPESALPKIVVRAKIVPMSDEEANTFENSQCPLTWNRDQLIKDIVLIDLVWMNEQSDFRQTLRRYIASDKIQREIQMENSK